MADTDLFGLLSLLLAAAGAAYLVWARVLRPGAEKAAVPSGSAHEDRAADTMPPVLRPEAELSPKMLAKREALAKHSSRPPPPAGKSEPPPPKAESAKAESATGEPLRTKADAPKSEAKPAASTKNETPTNTKAAPKSESAKAAPSKDAKAAPSKDAKAASSKDAKAAPSKDAKPASKDAKPASKDAKAASSKDAKPASKDAKPAAAPAAEKAPASKKSVDAFDDVPRIDVEDDEDVEPTKVGRFVKENAIQPIVEKIVFDEEAATPPGESSAGPLLVVFALAQTDTGKRRKQNEDSLLVSEDASVFVVADGMGGHRGGQHASRLAVKTIGDAFESKTFDAAPHKDIPVEASELARAMQMANSAIFHEAKQKPELTGMGTTLCAARFTPDKRRLYLGHVGDSRCYRVRDGVMKQLTNDHTMADYGVAGPEGAHLSRALGVWPTVPIDMIMAAPKLGDLYLLCSDGLTKMVPDSTIATQLLHEEDPKAAVERLVFFANAAGGKDNITIILLRVVEPDWKPPTPAT